MASVLVHVIDSGGKKHQVNMPENATIDRVITVLVDRLGMPPVDGTGKPIPYVLLHQRTGKRLGGQKSITTEGVAAGDTLQFTRNLQPDPATSATHTSHTRPAPPPLPSDATENKEVQPATPSPHGRQIARHPVTIAVASCLFLLLGYSVFHGGNSGGKNTAGPIPHQSNYSPEPAKTPGQLRQERLASATLAAWKDSAQFEENNLSKIFFYDTNAAATLRRYYRNLLSDDIDREFKAWIEELVEASDAVIGIQNQRYAELQSAQEIGDEKTEDLTGRAIEEQAKRGTTTMNKIARGAAGGLAVAALSTFDTELKKKKITNKYDQLFQNAQTTLKACHAKRAAIGRILFERYKGN